MIGAIIIGILAGFIATKLTNGESKGCLINLFLGLIGGAVGGWVFKFIGVNVNPGWIGELITGTIGAVIILWVWNKIIFIGIRYPAIRCTQSTFEKLCALIL